LRADGFIIRAQAMIRTDGFFVRAGFANTCALRAPTSFFVRIHTIRMKNEVLQGNRILRAGVSGTCHASQTGFRTYSAEGAEIDAARPRPARSRIEQIVGRKRQEPIGH
jgi:hypothetical protein